MAEDWHAVGVALKSRMDELRITQRELSERSGVSVATLRLLQQGGRKATNKTLEAVSRALGLPDDYLVSILLGTLTPKKAESTLADELASIHKELKSITERLEKIEKSRQE